MSQYKVMDAKIALSIIRRIEASEARLMKRLDAIDDRVRRIEIFRWKVVGGAVAIGAIVSLAAEFISKKP